MNDLQVVEQELSDAIMREMRQAMQTKNISLTLLADMSGVPLETVERLESGRLDVKLDEAMRVLGKLELTLKVVPLQLTKSAQKKPQKIPKILLTICRFSAILSNVDSASS